MRLARGLILLFCFGLCGSLQAQYHLKFYTYDDIPLGFTLGETDSFHYYVKNTGNTAFTGNFQFAYSVNNGNIDTVSLVTTSSGFEVDFLGFSGTLNVGDSMQGLIIAHFTEPKFMAGPSVVVIWPIVSPPAKADSLIFPLYLLEDPNAIDDREAIEQPFYYYNDILMYNQTNVHFKHVRIFNSAGAEVFEGAQSGTTMRLPELPSGIYVAQILLSDNRTKIMRFIRSPE